MFGDMNAAFNDQAFEFQQYVKYNISTFLSRFDAIHTLNQDLLLERHYLSQDISLTSGQRWNGAYIPGVKPIPGGTRPLEARYLANCEPDPSSFVLHKRSQPYFKLHGSCNWFNAGADGVIVLGGNKRSIVDKYPILKWSHTQFKTSLAAPDTRLMVIGYSFSDDHINEMIREAAREHKISIFVIDPLGVDVMDENRTAQIYVPGSLADELWPRVIGSSRRTLREIFGTDRVEHSKVMRFFS